MTKALTPIQANPRALGEKTEWLIQRDDLLEKAQAVNEVSSPEALDASGAIQTAISKHIKALEQERKSATAPIDAVKKAIMAHEKELRADLEKELYRIKKMNDAYATELERQRQAEIRRREEEEYQRRMAEAERTAKAKELFGDEAEARPLTEPDIIEPEPEKVKTSANKTVTRWSFQIIDAAAIPPDFTAPDEKKIRAHMLYKTKIGETPEIPGVNFTSRQSIESR